MWLVWWRHPLTSLCKYIYHSMTKQEIVTYCDIIAWLWSVALLRHYCRHCCDDTVTLLWHYRDIVVHDIATLLRHYYDIIETLLWRYCDIICDIIVTLLWHYCDIIVTLLWHYRDIVVTIIATFLRHYCDIIVTLLFDLFWPDRDRTLASGAIIWYLINRRGPFGSLPARNSQQTSAADHRGHRSVVERTSSDCCWQGSAIDRSWIAIDRKRCFTK